MARNCIRAGSRGRFFTTVDLVNQLEAQARASCQGRLADYFTRLDFVILDELGYLPFAQAGAHLLFHLISRLYERTSIMVTTNPAPYSTASLFTATSSRQATKADASKTAPDLKTFALFTTRPSRLRNADQLRPGRALPAARLLELGSILDANRG